MLFMLEPALLITENECYSTKPFSNIIRKSRRNLRRANEWGALLAYKYERKKKKSCMTYRASELENVSSGHGNLDSFVAFYWYDTSRRKELLRQLRSTKDLQEDGNKWTGRKEGRAIHGKMFRSL
jgi:hypothetical protein